MPPGWAAGADAIVVTKTPKASLPSAHSGLGEAGRIVFRYIEIKPWELSLLTNRDIRAAYCANVSLGHSGSL
ncbi:hypothetical protein GCM10007898_36860 [Dyella flagellata]|uniref:Uncharacterized protein n=1 Tax=Dyella flagellata TaxID=1867833 RepID=A0ABQ5XHK3_9GAMM|nr:hypothetical protein GCM10007898_36860 [Dyella flagellata]